MAWYPPQKRRYKFPFDPYNPIDPQQAYHISLMNMMDLPGIDKSMRKEWSDTPFFPQYEEDVGVVSKDVSPFNSSWIRGDDVVDEPGYDYGLKNPNPGPYLGSSPYINTTRIGDISQTPQYDDTMGAGAGGAAPTPFTRRKGGFKRVLKHLAAMESPGPDWSLEAKKSGPASPWGIANAPWKALSPGQDWLERQRKKERPA